MTDMKVQQLTRWLRFQDWKQIRFHDLEDVDAFVYDSGERYCNRRCYAGEHPWAEGIKHYDEQGNETDQLDAVRYVKFPKLYESQSELCFYDLAKKRFVRTAIEPQTGSGA